jgi:hypothetical protein
VYFLLFTREKIPDLELVLWKNRGFEALKALDDSNKLSSYVLSNNTEKIQDELSGLLPIGVNYKVLICDQTCPSLKLSSEKVASVSYFVAGNATHVEPREVLLYMWG